MVLQILLHGDISLPDATSYDNMFYHFRYVMRMYFLCIYVAFVTEGHEGE